MAKPKTLEQLRADKERAETQLAQEQHKLERLENRKKYLEKGERQKRTHRLCNLGGTIESLARLSESRSARPPISSVSISARPPKRRWRTKSSVCSVKKSAKCDFFVNLIKKSLTIRFWKNSQVDFDFLRRSPCRVRHCRVA